MFNWLKRLLWDASKPAQEPAVPQQQSAELPKQASVSAVPWHRRDQVDYLFAGWLFEAENHPDVFTNKTEDAILAALDEAVKSGESGAHMVQRIPGVIPQLLQSLRDHDFSGQEVARTISSDIVLVAEVLRMANSASYSRGMPITGIEQAILILGQNGLRQLITGVAFKPIVNLKSGSFTKMVGPRLWQQSEHCALACCTLAQGEPVDSFDAFLAGLIQNVGLTVSLRVIDKISGDRMPVGSPIFCNALSMYGRTLTVNIAREWHFPETVINSIQEQVADPSEPKMSPLGRILLVGDYLSKMDILARHKRVDVDDKASLEGLSDREIDCLRELTEVKDKDWAQFMQAGMR